MTDIFPKKNFLYSPISTKFLNPEEEEKAPSTGVVPTTDEWTGE